MTRHCDPRVWPFSAGLAGLTKRALPWSPAFDEPDRWGGGAESRPGPRARRAKIFPLAVVLCLPTWLVGQESLRLVVRESFLPGVPVLLRVELLDPAERPDRSAWEREALLSARGAEADVDVEISPETVPIRNGVGSALLRLSGAGDVVLSVRLDGSETSVRLRDARNEERRGVAGRLPEGLTEWDGVVHVTADLEVPAGATLRLLPGTLVLLDGVEEGEDGVDIDVRGRLEAAGTAARPVTLTATDPLRPWGEIDLQPGAEGVFSYAHLTRGGHSPSVAIARGGPVLRLTDAILLGDSVALTDHDGKGLYALGGRVELGRSVVARCVLGIQAEGTDVTLTESQLSEMVGETDEDDNDFLHLSGVSGAEVVRLTDCVFADGTDDAVDLQEIDGAEIVGCIFRDLGDKGISVFHEELYVTRCLFVGNRIAISTKAGDSERVRVHVDRSTLVDNFLAIEARDKLDVPEARIYYDVVSSILRRGDDPDARVVRTDYDPSFITIRYSNLSDEWDEGGSRGNLTEDPHFADASARDYRLLGNSPCIDRGDPDAPLDPDGTRADQGAFPFSQASTAGRFVRGETNGDDRIDISDAVLLLFHLAFGVEIRCPDAGDLDDDGRLNLTDAVSLLNFLFLGGSPPSAPFPACGNDPVPDGLGCEAAEEC